MDLIEEQPLNLTIKKKPIAIVAPSAVIDASNQNANKTMNQNKFLNEIKYCEETPEDLSVRKKDEEEDDFLYEKNINKEFILNNELHNNNNNNTHEDIEKYLMKNETRNSYNKNSFEETVKEYDLKSNIFKDVYKISDFYETLANRNLATPENIYSVINHLAEHKFLTAWYMNSVLSMPYMNLNGKNFLPATNSPSKNSILNNLLDKKPSGDYNKTALNFDTIIKNEMRKDRSDKSEYFFKNCKQISSSR